MDIHNSQQQQEQGHARVLLALHHEFLSDGLISAQAVVVGDGFDEGCADCDGDEVADTDQLLLSSSGKAYIAQTATGAFPPLRYTDSARRVVVTLRALAMFDDLIVNATASPLTAGGAGNKDDSGETVVSRRLTFKISRWLLSSPEDDRDSVHGKDDREHYQRHRCEDNLERIKGEDSPAAASSSPHPFRPQDYDDGFTQGRHRCPTPLIKDRDQFRSKVLFGLLLHLCPPAGQFADLFGLEEGLRQVILSMLAARDLATFGLASRAGAMSAAADTLWASLVSREFTEREQHSVLFLQSSPDIMASAGSKTAGTTGTERSGGTNGGVDRARTGGGPRTKPTASGTCNLEGQQATSGNDLGGSDGRNGAGAEGGGGASRRLYAKLHSARLRRAAIAVEHRRRSSILEMSALGRLGRTWGLYPWAPYRGPYRTSPGPAFPEYSWGPGIGPAGGPVVPDGTAEISPSWHGGGWGRRLGWRPFGGARNVSASAMGIGDVDGWLGGMGGGGEGGVPADVAPPPPYGHGRRGGGRIFGHFPGL